MDEQAWKRLRGLRRLIHDGVEQGAHFVERHHRHAANKPFDLLESVEPIATPTKVVHTIHDGVLSVTYGSIRAINRVTALATDWAVDRLATRDSVDVRQDPAEESDGVADESGPAEG